MTIAPGQEIIDRDGNNFGADDSQRLGDRIVYTWTPSAETATARFAVYGTGRAGGTEIITPRDVDLANVDDGFAALMDI